jgi:hypothetical protein
MDTVTLIVEGFRVIFGFLNLFFVPGFVISLVLYPRFTDLGSIQRLAYSTVLSIGSVISLVLFMDVVLGMNTTSANISLVLGAFSAFMLLIWLCEIWYLSSNLPSKLHQRFSGRFLGLQRYFSRIINARRDRFRKTAMKGVVWHENLRSGRNQIDHTYLIDAGDEIDIQLVDENKLKISNRAMLPPPYPKTRYFELVIREYKEDGLSLIDDIHIYPVQVTGKPEGNQGSLGIKPGTLKISRRLYKKADISEVQWIYSHDFHIFAIIHSQDTLGQMVDRVLSKLDEIVTSIKSGSRVSSHMEETQKLKDEFEIVLEKPRILPGRATVKHTNVPILTPSIEDDRRKLQADIVRDLKVHHVTPETFRNSDRMITDIKIPEKTDVDKLKSSIREIQDDNWLYE